MLQPLCEMLYRPHFFVLFLSLDLGMSPLQDSIFWGTSCGHRDRKGAGVSTPEAPVQTHWASSPKSCSSTGGFLSLSHTTPGSPGATQSHSRSLQNYDLGFPRHGPAASGSVGACLGGGTL